MKGAVLKVQSFEFVVYGEGLRVEGGCCRFGVLDFGVSGCFRVSGWGSRLQVSGFVFP